MKVATRHIDSDLVAIMSASIGAAFLGALQASVSVLLTISYGVIAAQFGFLDASTAKKISSLCVKLFLPALLITKVGTQLNMASAPRYAPIIVWSLAYNSVSITVGLISRRLFKLPSWVTPAVTFNNTIAMPLLLTQALGSTGILDSILWGSGDTVSEAVTRAQSYFLVNAMIADSLTFGLGPRLLGGPHEDDGPDQPSHKEDADEQTPRSTRENGTIHSGDPERGGNCNSAEEEEEIQANEDTSLLPNSAVRVGTEARQTATKLGRLYWRKLPSGARTVLDFAYTFISPPLIGAVIGVIIGLVPGLQKAFFNNSNEGGFFNAWLTASIKNIGELFTALQIVVVGVKLGQSLMRMKKGEENGNVPWIPMTFVTLFRFIIWPAVSIPIIYALATRTSLLGEDPILWFAMMLMPCGPPALKLTALADVAGAEDQEKMAIAKFLTISYVISPLLSFAVVGAHKASSAAVG